MPRHINLRNHGDITVGSIFHHFPHILLGVTAAVRSVVVESRHAPDDCLRTFRAHLGKPGIAVDLHTPSLVLGEMPVEGVDVVECQHIDELLDEAHLEIMAGTVEHRTPITEAGIIGNADSREVDLLRLLQRQRLAQRLDAVEHAARRLALHRNALGLHGDDIPIFVLNFRIELQRNGCASPVRPVGYDSRSLPDVLFQKCGIAEHRPVRSCNVDGGASVQNEGFAFPGRYALWQGYYLIVGICGMKRETRHHHGCGK